MANPSASCPDCLWPIVAVIGRVDRVALSPVPWWRRWFSRDDPFSTRAGPLCTCARCASQFYIADGQVQKFLVGVGAVREPARATTTHANGPTSQTAVSMGASSLDDLMPPP